MTGPQVTAAQGCRHLVSRLWHHWLLRHRTRGNGKNSGAARSWASLGPSDPYAWASRPELSRGGRRLGRYSSPVVMCLQLAMVLAAVLAAVKHLLAKGVLDPR